MSLIAEDDSNSMLSPDPGFVNGRAATSVDSTPG